MDWDQIRRDAAAAIEDAGRPATFQRAVKGTDADRPWRATPSFTPVPGVYMAFVEYEQRDIDGTRVKTGDKRAIVAALSLSDVDPTTSDRVQDGSTTFSVVSVKPVKPGPLPVTYELQLRA